MPYLLNPVRFISRFHPFWLTCSSIAANALCAGGVFTFPLISASLASQLKLTQPQLTTIVLAGVAGQYPFGAVVGKVVDHYGPWAASLIASILFSLGFGLFSWEMSKLSIQPSTSVFYRLTFYYFLAGIGTVLSYFSSLFAASKIFPDRIGFATGVSTALFGLSPLFLSVVASHFFTCPDTGFDVTAYLMSLAVLCGIVHLLGAFTLRTPSTDVVTSNVTPSDLGEDAEADERTPLLPSTPVHKGPDIGTALDLLRDPSFWVLWTVVFITLGACEMVMSNLGSIVVSLPLPEPATNSISKPAMELITSTQVRLVSLANTISRLVVGPLSDFVSPVASYMPASRGFVFPRKHRVSRVAFLTGATAFLALTFTWMTVGVRSQAALWTLSVGTGIAYGSAFTVLPSIVSSIWGLSNLGRNFGLVTYAPFVGTPAFSYLYAFVSASHARDDGLCHRGAVCWGTTFSVGAVMAGVACLASGFLWRRWLGRL